MDNYIDEYFKYWIVLEYNELNILQSYLISLDYKEFNIMYNTQEDLNNTDFIILIDRIGFASKTVRDIAENFNQ